MSVVPALFVNEAVLSLLSDLGEMIYGENFTIYVRVYFCAVSFIPRSVCLSLHQYHIVLMTNFVIIFEIRSMRPPTLFFFKVILALWSPLV